MLVQSTSVLGVQQFWHHRPLHFYKQLSNSESPSSRHLAHLVHIIRHW